MEPALPAPNEESRTWVTEDDGTLTATTRNTMTTTTTKRKRSRARRRGITSTESVLVVAAMMGCFVYPLSLAMRSTGERIADESERGHEVMLAQPR